MIMETMQMAAADLTSQERKPSFLNLLICKCPRCRRGDMFIERNPYILKTTMKMNEHCPVCGQPFDIEVGFYFGSSYVSYALAVALTVATFIAWWVLIGFSLHDNRLFYWIAVNAVILIGLQPVLMRVARTLWLAFFVRYNKDWRTTPATKPERTNDDQKNNW
jgi:Protein of unknown function (DUF983)